LAAEIDAIAAREGTRSKEPMPAPAIQLVRRSARMRLMSRAAAEELQSRLAVADHFIR